MYIDNALKRMIKCSPPTLELRGLAWNETCERDQNGLPIYKPAYHTCGVENWNSQQIGFVPGGHCNKTTATAFFYEGNAKLIAKKEVRRRSHRWPPLPP